MDSKAMMFRVLKFIEALSAITPEGNALSVRADYFLKKTELDDTELSLILTKFEKDFNIITNLSFEQAGRKHEIDDETEQAYEYFVEHDKISFKLTDKFKTFSLDQSAAVKSEYKPQVTPIIKKAVETIEYLLSKKSEENNITPIQIEKLLNKGITEDELDKVFAGLLRNNCFRFANLGRKYFFIYDENYDEEPIYWRDTMIIPLDFEEYDFLELFKYKEKLLGDILDKPMGLD